MTVQRETAADGVPGLVASTVAADLDGLDLV